MSEVYLTPEQKIRQRYNWFGMVLILVSQLSQQKEMGYPFSYFGKNNFKEVPHAAGNDYKDTPSF